MDANCLLVKTAPEIHTKSAKVRERFLRQLQANIQILLARKGLANVSLKPRDSLLLASGASAVAAAPVIANVFGVQAVEAAHQTTFSSRAELTQLLVHAARETLTSGNSFALRINRVGKHDFSSMQLAAEAGKAIQDAIPALSVDLEKPDKEIVADIRHRNAYLITGSFPGVGGFPVGSEGTLAFFFEGKPREALAAWLLLRRGCELFAVVDKETKAVTESLERLLPWHHGKPIPKINAEELNQKIQAGEVLALGRADASLDSASLQALDASFGAPVYRPLLAYPPQLLPGKQRLLEALA